MWFRSATLAIAVTLLCSCGFKLRTVDIGHLNSVQVTTSGEYGATRAAFRSALAEYGVGSSSPADVIVQINGQRSTRRPIATTTNMNTAEYELKIEVEVLISSGSKDIEATLVSERVYTVNQTNLSGSYEEQSSLMEEMRAEIAMLMIRRVEAMTLTGQRSQ